MTIFREKLGKHQEEPIKTPVLEAFQKPSKKYLLYRNVLVKIK